MTAVLAFLAARWIPIAAGLALLAAGAGGVLYIQKRAFDAGYAKAREVEYDRGFKAGREAAQQDFDTALALANEQTEREQRAAAQALVERERRYADDMARSTEDGNRRLADVEQRHAGLLAAIAAGPPRGPLRCPDSPGRLPAPAAPGPAAAVPGWVLSAGAVERLAGRAADADRLNVWYGQCLRAYETLRRDGQSTDP